MAAKLDKGIVKKFEKENKSGGILSDAGLNAAKQIKSAVNQVGDKVENVANGVVEAGKEAVTNVNYGLIIFGFLIVIAAIILRS